MDRHPDDIVVTDGGGSAARAALAEALLAMVEEQLPAGLWTTDADLRVTSIAGRAFEMIGAVPESVVGHTVTELVGTSDPANAPLAAHRRALAGEPSMYRSKRSGIDYQAWLAPLRDPYGQVVGTTALACASHERHITASGAEHELIGHAVTQMAANLLAMLSPDDSLVDALGELGRGFDVDQVCLFENDHSTQANRSATIRARWTKRPEVTPEHYGEVSYYHDVHATLSLGEPVQRLYEELPEGDRVAAERFGVRAFHASPIQMGGRWWGTLVLIMNEEARRWTPAEAEWASDACELIGAVFERGALAERIAQVLEARGMPRGTWLVDIEQVRSALQDADAIMRRLKDAFVSHGTS